MLDFFVKCNPPRSTAQSARRVGIKKDGTPFSYKTAKGKQQEQDFMSLLLPFQPVKPLEGALSLKVIYMLPFLKAEKKAIRAWGRTYHDRKPDCDNLVKMFQDCLGKLGFYNDDGQIVELFFQKLRCEVSGIRVTIDKPKELEPRTLMDL